ncbi:MAG: hypothetical protein HGB33_07130 [Syntrophaceae bacterium]|nr:hypothetical protein [Syntrophaceae bacterium]
MGIILQGILGGFSGKVGPVVGAKWKDIDYMRSYVIPSNPQTVDQTTQRDKFKKCVLYGRDLLGSLLQPYWDMFYSNMSGFNAWISNNLNLLDGSKQLTASAIMSKGTLEGVSAVTATYATASGEVELTWDGTIFGNGETTDLCRLVVYDKANEDLYFFGGIFTRADENFVATIKIGLTATGVIAYLFFTRGTGSELVVSDSIGDVCAAP